MKYCIAILAAVFALLTSGCVSAYSPRKTPSFSDDTKIHLTFNVRKGVPYILKAGGIAGELPVEWRLREKKENWVPVAARITSRDSAGRIITENIQYLKHAGGTDSRQPGVAVWEVWIFAVETSGRVDIWIEGDVAFLNKGRTWRLYHGLK